MRQLWRAVGGDVRVPPEEAEWWGASLAVLVAAIHHPGVLAAHQPGTDPSGVARDVLVDVGQLQEAAVCAAAQAQRERPGGRRWRAAVRREGDEVVFSPGPEVANLALCLEIFATAVLEPAGGDATTVRGATAYAASAWSTDIARASGALADFGRGEAAIGVRTARGAIRGDAPGRARAGGQRFRGAEPSGTVEHGRRGHDRPSSTGRRPRAASAIDLVAVASRSGPGVRVSRVAGAGGGGSPGPGGGGSGHRARSAGGGGDDPKRPGRRQVRAPQGGRTGQEPTDGRRGGAMKPPAGTIRRATGTTVSRGVRHGEPTG
ncbi:MAG: hypothetical protein ABR540_19650 [Acidimicrobiales bacterium]